MKADAEPLHEPLAGGSAEGTSVAVTPLLAGEIRAPRSLFEAESPGTRAILRILASQLNRTRWEWWPIPAFLIEHPSKGPILVDTGLHASTAADPKANLGRLYGTLSKLRFPNEPLPSQLRGRGIDPKSISTVIITHLHFDHSSGITEFPNAAFVLSAAEWQAATTVERPWQHGYRREHFDYLFEYRTIDFENADVTSYSTFGRTFDLLGDGSVRLALTPGHTAGHLSVICRLAERDFVIAGDAVYTEGQLRGQTVPPRPEDFHKWERSQRELERFAGQHPDATIVPGHDPDHWATLEERYE